MSAERAELPQPSIRMRLPAHSGAASGFSCRQSPYLHHKDSISDCAASVPASHRCTCISGTARSSKCSMMSLDHAWSSAISTVFCDAEAHCLCVCTAAPLEWPIAASFEESLPEGAGPEVAQVIWNETLSAHDDADVTQRCSWTSTRSSCWAACPLRGPDAFTVRSALQRELAVRAAYTCKELIIVEMSARELRMRLHAGCSCACMCRHPAAAILGVGRLAQERNVDTTLLSAANSSK